MYFVTQLSFLTVTLEKADLEALSSCSWVIVSLCLINHSQGLSIEENILNGLNAI